MTKKKTIQPTRIVVMGPLNYNYVEQMGVQSLDLLKPLVLGYDRIQNFDM